MPFVQFHDYLPELAERETRTITIFPGSGFDLPPTEYGLVEMFCDEPGCDCRRVIFMVMSSMTEKPEAFVSFGWESRQFYEKWMGDDDPFIITELMGPALNFGSPAARHAPAILEMVKEVALNDPDYVARVKQHYALFREKIDGRMNRQQRRRAGRKR
jgi:hypothetical protein